MRKFIRSSLLLVLISLLALGLSCAITPQTTLGSAPVTAAPSRPQITPSPTPAECLGHASQMTLTASQAQPEVGSTLLLTATLTNVGECAMIGLPRYYLQMQSASSTPILEPQTFEPTTHSLGLFSGETDSITYTLQVVGSGAITLSVTASYEVHLGYPGPAYWSGDASGPLALNIPAADPVLAALYQAAYSVNCAAQTVIVKPDSYHLHCDEPDGFDAYAYLQFFPNEAAAQAAFQASRGSFPQETFACYPSYQWYIEPAFPASYERGHSWQAGRWRIIITNIVGDPSQPGILPQDLSRAIQASGANYALFPACHSLYLTFASR